MRSALKSGPCLSGVGITRWKDSGILSSPSLDSALESALDSVNSSKILASEVTQSRMDAARNLRGNQTGRTRTKIEVGNSRTQGHPLVLDIVVSTGQYLTFEIYSPLSEAIFSSLRSCKVSKFVPERARSTDGMGCE